ncbi:MAG: COG1361 S-layer family protein [archaeon]
MSFVEKRKIAGLLFAFFAVFVCGLVAGGLAAAPPSSNPDIIFISSRIDPAAVTPGGNLNFNVITQNWATTPASEVIVKIILPDDFVLKNTDMAVQNVGPICAICNFETKYSIKVDEKAISGDYLIKVVAEWSGGSREKEFTVSVQGSPKVVVTFVSYAPEEIEPGKTATVTMVVKNIGSAPALNGAAKLTIPVLTGDTKGRFSVIGSGTEFPIGSLGVGEAKEFVFRLATDKNVEAGVYNFPLEITYSGQTSESGIGLVVVSKALLTLPKVQTDPVNVIPDKAFLLSATVENTGKNEGKSVTVEFIGENGRISGQKSAYLGTIKAGDKDVALFEMTYAGPVLAKTTVPVAFRVTYTDDFGEHSFTENGEITVEVGIAAAGGPSVTTIILVVAGIAIAVWFFFFRKRRGSMKK